MSGTTVRPATFDDLRVIIEMGADMHAHSNFALLTYDPEYFGNFLVNLIASEGGDVLLAEQEGEVCGALLCSMSATFFGPDRIANEFAFYVKPGSRGGCAAFGLVRSYVSWAREKGAKRITAGNSAGTCDEAYVRLLKHAGFERAGSLMYMNLGD